MLTVQLPDGSSREVPGGLRLREALATLAPDRAARVLAARLDGELIDVEHELPPSGAVHLELLTTSLPELDPLLQYSAAVLVTRALFRLHAGVELSGLAVPDGGFSCSVFPPAPLTADALANLQAEVAQLCGRAEPFERIHRSRAEGRAILEDLGQGPQAIRTELLGDVLDFVRQGEFLALCDGLLLPDAGKVGAVRLTVARDTPDGGPRLWQLIEGAAAWA
jgi:threonyl-tRNA synthetase